ncbi:MAG: hypothetical protein WC988_03520 [Patescibacteria group bacterium]
MSDTAQNANVNDIWSLPDPPVNLTDDQNQKPTQKPLGSSFGKPGIAGGGEGGGGLESDITAQELLNKARKEEAGRSAEIYEAPETLVTLEVGEKLKPAEVHKPKEEKSKEPQVAQPEAAPLNGTIVDKRTGRIKTHRVAEIADETTKKADIKEQEFIEGVEQVHSII